MLLYYSHVIYFKLPNSENESYRFQNNAQSLWFEWSHFGMSSTESKVRATFLQHYKQYHWKLLSSFHMNGHTLGFHSDSKVRATLYMYSIVNSTTGKYCSVTHLNGHTIGFHPQTQKLEPACMHNKQYDRKVLLRNFYLNGYTVRFFPQT